MITQQSQIKINLPLALKEFIESKANRYDMPIASYIKHLIIKDISDMNYPTFQISESSEIMARKALREKKKAVIVSDISNYFRKL